MDRIEGVWRGVAHCLLCRVGEVWLLCAMVSGCSVLFEGTNLVPPPLV